MGSREGLAAGALAAATALGGCSFNQVAVDRLGDALAGSGATFASDDDPALVQAAAPFSLKLMESLIAQSPRHEGLLVAATRGFTQYSYAFVQEEADETEARDATAAAALHARARALYRRARGYGLRALEVEHPRFEETLRADPPRALATLGPRDAEALYWTTVAWAAEIALSVDSMDSVSELRLVDAMVRRLSGIDIDMDRGALRVFLVSYEMGRPGASRPEIEARRHFEAAVRLTEGQAAGPYVAFAESVCVKRGDRAQFVSQLRRALAVDTAARPEWRLENSVMQRRARWLLSRVDDLFLE